MGGVQLVAGTLDILATRASLLRKRLIASAVILVTCYFIIVLPVLPSLSLPFRFAPIFYFSYHLPVVCLLVMRRHHNE